jgi:hypothetical protein
MLPSRADSYRRGLSLLGAKILLESNRRDLISDDEYFLGKGAHLHSLLSNFRQIDEIPPPGEPDIHLSLVDEPGKPILFSPKAGGRYAITGCIWEKERACQDKRTGIFGNMGLFSKILVRELETRGIYSFHSTSFVDRARNRLYLTIGGSGSGKSTVLLKAISLGGMEVFGTELTHFAFREGEIVMLKGSLWQNCRMGNLVLDFPELLGRFGLKAPESDPWHVYKSVSLHAIQTAENELASISIVVVMPRIEGERTTSSMRLVPKSSLRMMLFQNLSDKVSPASLIWGTHFVPSLDSADRQYARMVAAENFIEKAKIAECWNVLASPARCLDGIFPADAKIGIG